MLPWHDLMFISFVNLARIFHETATFGDILFCRILKSTIISKHQPTLYSLHLKGWADTRGRLLLDAIKL